MTPRWASRPVGEQDRGDVLAMFTEADFYYRTVQPDTRPEWAILDLLGDDTRLLLADRRPAGLYAIEEVGSEHGCHLLLRLRLRAAAAPSWWASAYQEIVRATRWRRELVRLSMQFAEFDDRGLQFARALGLTEEGTLAAVTARGGQRFGSVYFAQIWTPEA